MPTYTPSNTPYQARTFQDMLVPLAKYAEVAGEYEKQTDDYLNRLATLRAMMPENDPEMAAALDEAEASYNDAWDRIQSNGLSLNDKNSYRKAHAMYRDRVLPYHAAMEAREAVRKAHEANMANRDVRYQTGKGPNDYNISAYLHGNRPEIAFVQGENVAKEAHDLMQAIQSGQYTRGGVTYSLTKKGIYGLQKEIDTFLAAMSSGDYEKARRIGNEYVHGRKNDPNANGPLWEIYRQLQDKYGINGNNFNDEAQSYLNNQIILGMKRASDGVDIYESKGTAIPIGNGNGTDKGELFEDADGWWTEKIKSNLQINGKNKDITTMRYGNGNRNGKRTFGLKFDFKVKEKIPVYQSVTGMDSIRRQVKTGESTNWVNKNDVIPFDKFLTVKDGSVVLKSDDEIKKIINDKMGGRTFKDNSVYTQYINQIKSVYNDITSAYKQQSNVSDFMNLGGRAFGSDMNYDTELVKAYNGRTTRVPLTKLREDDVVMDAVKTNDDTFNPNARNVDIFIDPSTADVKLRYTNSKNVTQYATVKREAINEKYPEYFEMMEQYKDEVNDRNMSDATETMRTIEITLRNVLNGEVDSKKEPVKF